MIKFCARHSLSLSVKAGGYGTHGQAVQGDIILDVSILNNISIEKMNSEGGFTSIKDMPSLRTAGKGREEEDELLPEANISFLDYAQEFQSTSIGKRRVDDAFGEDTSASKEHQTMSSFQMSSLSFASGGLVAHNFERGRPLSKLPRTEGSSLSTLAPHLSFPSTSSSSLIPVTMTRPGSTGSISGEESTSGSGECSRSSHSLSGSSLLSHDKSTTTNATSVHSRTSKSPPSQSDVFDYTSNTSMPIDSRMGNLLPLQSDPFGYMSGSSEAMPSVPPLPASIVAQPVAQSGSSLFSSTGHYMPTRVNPIYSHAFVTFGAGAKQKDVDVYCASHPLPATSIEGIPCFTPYHVPFSAHPVGASVMILGGFGFLSRLRGLSIDNLVEVEMVLADGSIVVVNETEHPGMNFYFFVPGELIECMF